jgi:transcription factor C subunit 3
MQSEIRWRLRSVYDKQEVLDILRYLSREGYLCVRYDNCERFGKREFFFPYDEEEENQVYWFIGEKHWYQA